MTITSRRKRHHKDHKQASILNLALFDLDNTLIAGDSDHLWGEFLVEKQLVNAHSFKATNDQFYEDYKRGELDIIAYLKFALSPLAQYSMDELQALHAQFMESKIQPIMLPAACALVEKHRSAGDKLLIITATNSFITRPIATALGIDELLASEAEIIDNRYTGNPIGTPCYQQGKVERLKAWLAEQEQSFELSFFYSDSANDIPLLDFVDKPVAVDPDSRLHDYAKAKGFPIMSLR